VAAVPAPPKPTEPPRPPTVVSSISDADINTLLPAGLVKQNTVDSYGGSCKTLEQSNHEFVKFLSGWHLAAAAEHIPGPPTTDLEHRRSRRHRHLLTELNATVATPAPAPAPAPTKPPPPAAKPPPPPPPETGRRFVAGCKDIKVTKPAGTKAE